MPSGHRSRSRPHPKEKKKKLKIFTRSPARNSNIPIRKRKRNEESRSKYTHQTQTNRKNDFLKKRQRNSYKSRETVSGPFQTFFSNKRYFCKEEISSENDHPLPLAIIIKRDTNCPAMVPIILPDNLLTVGFLLAPYPIKCAGEKDGGYPTC